VTEEATFPIESMANDPTAQVIMKEMKITPAKVKELGQAVLSVKVQAVKGK
jgi:hypothetical protein